MSVICKHKLLTVLVTSVSNIKKFLVKIVTIILFKFKNVSIGQLFKAYHKMFRALLCHYLVTSKDRDCIMFSRSFVSGSLDNLFHWYRDSNSRSLPKVVRTFDIKWAIIHVNRFSVSTACQRAGRAETDEQHDQQLQKN